MKRRNFIQTAAITSSSLLAGKLSYAAPVKAGKKELFELREYEIHFGGNQNALHAYLEKALIPAFNKFGVKSVGVFKEIGKTEPAKVYVLIVYPSMEDYGDINMKVKSDNDFKQNSAEWDKMPADKPVFNRYNSSLLVAFDNMPSLKVPAKETRIFELRTYEGYNEDAVRRKIRMFNTEEFTIFDRTKLNRVFFGEAIAGPNLPCLTYMITFKDMEERDKNWAAFGADADWKKVSNDPQYANTVSNIRRIFLEPVSYSQV
jgi:hypothetical protein